MISVSPSLVVRSSLEEMLDSLQRNDDEGKNPADLPPALPSRPASKARLPKRPVPAMFGASPDVGNTRKQDVNFGRKKVACGGGESPYTMAAVHECRMAENGDAGPSTPPSRAVDSGWDNNSIEYYIKKQLRVWCRVQNGQWELGKIQSEVGGKASVTLLDGAVMTVSTGELLPANAEILDGVDNLVGLGYLNEPSVLCNLQYRYHRDVIYTMAGPVLLAINPFKDIPISGRDVIMAYREKILDSPHVYAVTGAAYSDMMTDGVNQSIIISGESGAGKSVTAKLAIEYLVEGAGEDSDMACKIRETGYILEAFGNAKTSRNKNSSRFGKLVDIHYNSKGIIQGAYIHTLLLEKSRISQLCRSERSYHVFYQMCAGASSDMRDKLNLRMASEYKYLNQSGCLKIHDVDDAQNFQKLMEAMDALKISYEDQERVFKLLAAILWLGNISFEVTDHESHVTVMIDEASRSAARLMGCKVKELTLALSTNTNQTLTLQQAIDTRDALAKFMYTSLFSWLVEAINKSLKGEKEHAKTSISILDTYGFESFQKNSFDQLLINYADERLQQHFSRHLFKLEQEEYESEGIDWKKLEFVDNQGCLDFFETKNVGLISMLDEASNACEATDLTFVNMIKRQLSSSLRFNEEKAAFRVHHYAGEVQYETNGFLVKNRNTLQSDTILFLSSCCKNFLTSESNVSDLDKQSVMTKFKDQLFKLIQRLEKSKPRFIRCIRPNAKQLHGMYEKDIVLQQLRCSGILETVKMSKSRYPTRMTHQDFANRFGCLLSDNILCHDPLSTSVAILQQYHVLPEVYQLGYTKIYFRAETVSVLEKLRQEVKQGTYTVENRFLCGRVLCDYRELMLGIVTLQSFIRGENTRRTCYISTKPSHQLALGSVDRLRAVVHIQSVTRGWLSRRYFRHLLRWKKSAPDSPKTRRKSCSKVSEAKGVSQDVPILPSDVEELQKLVTKAEVSLNQKKHENSALREQVRQFEARWSEHEIKMKSVEETWQRQMASLQKSLAAAKKSLGADDSVGNVSGTENTVGNNGSDSAVDHLAKEFEQKRQNFDDDARGLIETKSIQIPYAKQLEEFKNVKERFEIWKKEYKHRLRETRTKLVKGLNGEGGKQSWWGKLSKRYTPV